MTNGEKVELIGLLSGKVAQIKEIDKYICGIDYRSVHLNNNTFRELFAENEGVVFAWHPGSNRINASIVINDIEFLSLI